MNKPIITHEDGTFDVLSSNGVSYYRNVQRDSCSCAGFIFRKTCRHTKIVQDLLLKAIPEIIFTKDIYNTIEFIDIYGTDILDKLERAGKIIRASGRIFVL